jgi:hypothetical protein
VYITSVFSKYKYASVAWNNLTLANSNKLEYMQRKFANLCCIRFIQPNSFCNFESMLNYFNFKTPYSTRQILGALFLINIFNNNINCCFVMDAVRLRVRTKQIRNIRNVSRLSPSTKCVTAANNTCKSPDVFNKSNISLQGTIFLA